METIFHRYSALLRPAKVWSRSEILSRPSPVPKSAGVYAWYFGNFPTEIPTDDCIRHNDLILLYVGIAPKAPPMNGTKPSAQTLRHRLRYHMSGNAEGSTLRLSLGCLLANKLGIELRRVGGGKRMTFAEGERRLSAWLGQNAFVAWLAIDAPWVVEEELIRNVSLPLNLDQNKHHAFHAVLSQRRRLAKSRARELPVI